MVETWKKKSLKYLLERGVWHCSWLILNGSVVKI